MTSSLIIATYNWPQALELVLLSILNQTKMPHEIIIADDGSREDTKALIDAFRPKFNIPIVHVWQPDNGFQKTQILNKAVKASKGDYIIQMDGDIVAHPQFIEDHIEKSLKGYFIRGSRCMLSEEHTKKVLAEKNFNINWHDKNIKNRFNAMRSTFLAFFYIGNKRNANDVIGCNTSFWKEDFIKVNGYDNNLNGWGHEDIELAARFINNKVYKHRVKYLAIGFHLHHKISSRHNESVNKQHYYKIVKEKIKTCENGYAQVTL
ncbi:galactosyltransferase-like protein [Chitinophaga skermanii]|uniref:Galactosyltransferase-like protein n=1 Tax=Chitinophaga skermanii TaxID=331697 RepID=A0A327QBS5_9BACT|nr:glycosyltransferase family 2 protein [Chitinophaga skermanii]RAJ01721.1 galactosyltransferase-like protein [Chitinophaga skermanii]